MRKVFPDFIFISAHFYNPNYSMAVDNQSKQMLLNVFYILINAFEQTKKQLDGIGCREKCSSVSCSVTKIDTVLVGSVTPQFWGGSTQGWNNSVLPGQRWWQNNASGSLLIFETNSNNTLLVHPIGHVAIEKATHFQSKTLTMSAGRICTLTCQKQRCWLWWADDDKMR